MGKLLKFLKPYAGAVVAIICILVVQAYCDLSLPTYTSDIVNVGIQQGGIDETVPDTISKKDLNHLLLLVPSDKQELVKNAYTKSTKKYDYKGTVMELKSSVKEDDKKMEKLSDILGKPMLLAAGFDSGSDMTQRIEDQMRTNMKKQVEAKQAEAKAQMEKAQKEAEDKINARAVSLGILVFAVLVSWGAIILNAPVLSFTSICSPVFGMIGCLIPAYLVYRVPRLHDLKGVSLYLIIATGILLIISPFLAFS